MSGFYLMHRGWQDNPVFRNETYSRRDAFIWLIEEAAWRSVRAHVGGREICLSRGQLSHSLRFMARAWKWDEARVRRFISSLVVAKIIDASTDAGQTIITVCNYEKYQALEKSDDAAIDAALTRQRRGDDAKKNEVNQGNQDSDANASDGDAVDPTKVMFDSGVLLLTRFGLTEGKARNWLGKALKECGAEAVIVAIGNAQRSGTPDPIPYMTAILKGGNNGYRKGSGNGAAKTDHFYAVLGEIAGRAEAGKPNPD